jgi:hypothetical protein
MVDQLGSTRFQTLFESALQAYERKTGITLAEHPLAVQLRSCHSVESITTLLQGQAQTFSDFRGRDKIMKLIESTLSILSTLSTIVVIGGASALVRQRAFVAYSTSLNVFFQPFSPASAIQAGLAILLGVGAFPSYHVRTLVTPKCIRRPRA